MLVLSRREGESLIIGDDVIVKIVSVKGGQVKIAIDAPKSVPVHREEIARLIEAQKLAEAG